MKALLVCFLGIVSGPVMALQVTVTIPPLAAMVKPFLSDGDTVTVLLAPGASPHGFQFRPSHLVALNQADLILTVGSGVDAWVEKPVAQRLAEGNAPQVVSMQKLPGLEVLPKRAMDSKNHHSHPEDAHGHPLSVGHPNLKMDGHTWLSVHNAGLMIAAIGQAMERLQPEKAHYLRQKQLASLDDLAQADAAIRQWLAPVKHEPYLVLHDAYQYFEKRYGLNNQGAIQLSAEVKPSVKRVLLLRERIESDGIRCVFKEPQFSDKQLRYIVRGLSIKIGELDPLGRNEASQSYAEFIQNLAQRYRSCLG